MKKPRKLNKPAPAEAGPAKLQEAPKAAKPRAPFERSRNPYAGRSHNEPPAARGGVHTKAGHNRPASRQANLETVSPSNRQLGAIVNRRAADRLRAGSVWVYTSDLESIELPKGGDVNPPALLPIADARGLLLGTGLYSPASQIALRLVSREALDQAGWLELLAARLKRSVERRKPMLSEETDACRLCFSEADELPGLVVDKYGELVVIQLLVKGLDSAAVRKTCFSVLREELKPAAILERPDPRMRELEGLAAPSADPLYLRKGATEAGSTLFRLNGLRFQFDSNSGQKTGAFLDQRENYRATQRWAEQLGATGRALDVCCYQGGFALHLAQVAQRVTGVDASRSSLEVAEKNLETNRERMKAEVDWVEADAFELLRDWSNAHESFDTIVLDPPAFAKSQRAVEGALRGYKELNLRALKMLRAGGLLVTCSCSHHVGWAELEGTVASAAADAGRRVRLLERRGAALDHPVILTLPESEYLKCLVLEVE
jgi:23S rRNA (cytosine1962-C5)-methyltransferase